MILWGHSIIKIYKSFYFSDSTLPRSEMYWCINHMVCNIGMVNNYGSDVDEKKKKKILY